MDRSVRSNLMITTTYLQHFSQNSLDKMKTCIYEQLNCKNEAEFLCKAIDSMYHVFTPESSTTIKNKTIEISETQTIETALNNCANNVSLYKYIQQKNNDILSRLNSDIIDHFATFFNKKTKCCIGIFK